MDTALIECRPHAQAVLVLLEALDERGRLLTQLIRDVRRGLQRAIDELARDDLGLDRARGDNARQRCERLRRAMELHARSSVDGGRSAARRTGTDLYFLSAVGIAAVDWVKVIGFHERLFKQLLNAAHAHVSGHSVQVPAAARTGPRARP
jgi:hypothetical protein